MRALCGGREPPGMCPPCRSWAVNFPQHWSRYPLYVGRSMTSPVVDIDPDGEVFIVIPAVVKTPEPAGAEQPSLLRLRVSKKHLMVASVRANKMFRMNCKESKPDEDGNFHWNFEPIFNHVAFETVMNIIHGQTHKTPDRVSFDMMADVAAITDDLQCHNAVKFVTNTWMDRLWMDQLRMSLPKEICPDLYKCILIAYVFEQPDLFESTTRLAIMQCTGTLSPGTIPINPAILGNLGFVLPQNEFYANIGQIASNQ